MLTWVVGMRYSRSFSFAFVLRINGAIVRVFPDSSKEFLREYAAPLQQRVPEKLREDIPEKNPNTKA
jgi:hypothetical protein